MTTKFNLPNLHGGISQLNPNLRDPGHFEASNNVLFDMFEGIQGPRWGTQEFINMPNTCKPLGYFTTSDGVLRWLVWNVENPADKKLEVWSHQQNVGVAVEGNFQYLMDAAGNLGDISLYPILDTVMVLNKQKVVETTGFGTVPYCYALVRVPEVFEGGEVRFAISCQKVGFHTQFNKNITSGMTIEDVQTSIYSWGLDVSPQYVHVQRFGRDGVLFRLTGAWATYDGMLWECRRDCVGITPSRLEHPGSSYWSYRGTGAFSAPAWDNTTNYKGIDSLTSVGAELLLRDDSSFEVITYSGKARRNPLVSEGGYDSYSYYLEAPSYEKLPPRNYTYYMKYTNAALPINYVYQVTPGYYVRPEAGGQRYEETSLGGFGGHIKKTSMPHELRYAPDTGEFFFGPSSKYDEFPRAVGDETSAPLPDFVGKPLNYIFFHRNRMCFLAGNFVCMSKAGHYYDWFPDTATEVLDSDPISVFPTHDRYTPLLWAKPFNKQLLLIGDNKQFVLHSGYDALSPTTVAVDEATNYQILPGVEPVQLPTSLLLGLDHSPWLGLVEYSVGDQEIQTEGFLVSNVVPKFIPYDITGLVWVPSQSMVLLWKRGSPEVWVFKFTDMGDGETGQMAWSKWTMVLPVEHCYHDVTSGIIYWALQNEPKSLCMIAKMDTTEDLKTTPQLDLRGEQIIDAATEIEVIWAPSGPFSQAPIGKYRLIDKSSKKSIGTTAGSGDNIKPDPNVFIGGPPSRVVYRGYEIPWSITLSPLILRDEAGKPRGDISCNIENIQIEWSGGDFEVHTSGLGLPKRTTRVVPLDQNYGSGYSPTNVLGTGASYQEPTPTRLMLMLPAKRATIELRNTSEGVFSTQVQSIGYNLDVVQDWG